MKIIGLAQLRAHQAFGVEILGQGRSLADVEEFAHQAEREGWPLGQVLGAFQCARFEPTVDPAGPEVRAAIEAALA